MLKAKRRLKNFDFEEHGANVSLVGPAVGSGANSRKVLAIKSTNQGIRPTDPVKVSKALEQITVTLSMEEFLRKFFSMWSDDAEVLTKLLGFETEHEAYMKEREDRESSEDSSDDEYDWDEEHEKWISERMSQFSLMKSLHENPNQTIADEDFISISILQSKLEESLSISKQQEENPLNLQVEKARYEQLEAVEKQHEATVAEAEQLKVAKSALETEVAELKAQIQKAVEEKEAAELAAFQESIKDLVAAEELVNVAKALFAMPEEARTVVVKSLQAKQQVVDKSDLLKEVTSGEDIADPVEVKKQALSKAFAV